MPRGRPPKNPSPPDERGEGTSSTLQAVERALRMLEVLADAPRPRTLQDIANHMGCSVSTAHRLATTLTAHHLAERDPASGRYRLGVGVFRLAAARERQVDLHLIARPMMDTLADRYLETVSLWVRRGHQALCLAVAEGTQEIRHYVDVGRVSDLSDLGAKSKVLLAALPDGEVDAALQPVRWSHFGATPADVRAELNAIRSDGIARAVDGALPDMAALAAAVRDAEGAIVAALAIAGPRSRFTDAAMAKTEGALGDAALALSHELGFQADRHQE